MAILLNAHQLRKSFGVRPLFKDLTFAVKSGDRIGLIGPNGAGKSTLLRILAGQMESDEGTLSVQRGLLIGYLEQVPSFSKGATVHATLVEGLRDPDDWEGIARVHEVLSKLSLLPYAETPVTQLSGGWKKRAALAREIVRQPDVVLLDEPTNHLDVQSILWLEELLAHAPFATVTVTHDRLFLQRVSNRILELDRRNAGGLLSVDGDYTAYLEIKDSLLSAQTQQEERLRNTLRRETEWLRRGAKARTTKQQARIERAGDLKQSVEELADRNKVSQVRIDIRGASQNPKKLIDAKGISKSYGPKKIVPQLDLRIAAGSRIGLLGTNGCGKSTLIRMLLGVETSDTGTIERAESLQVSYFEQNRESLNPALSVVKTLCPSGDHVDFCGTRVHVKSYLDRFKFTPEQMEMTVGKLSGGEQSRILLARMLLRPANLLVLDEPTNDLDMQTLEVLEEVLRDFAGAVLLVTHDRYFMDHVADLLLAFGRDPQGKPVITTFTGLSQWETWQASQPEDSTEWVNAPEEAPIATPQESRQGDEPKKKKLTFKEQRELSEIEPRIHAAEARVKELESHTTDPKAALEIVSLLEEIERLYLRWSELER